MVPLARRLRLPVVNNDWVRKCFSKKQLLPYQPLLLADRSSQDTEEVFVSDDSDQDPDFVPERKRRKTSPLIIPLLPHQHRNLRENLLIPLLQSSSTPSG